MCTLQVWKYRWQSITAPVWLLAKDPKRRAACAATESNASGAEAEKSTARK